jgi:hypothetical protein
MRPFMTVVLIPTAGHMESANRNMGFSFNSPLKTSWDGDFVDTNIFPPTNGAPVQRIFWAGFT